MKERRIYDEVETKLAAVCRKNRLLYRFSCGSYPLVLTVQPDASLDGQLSMLEMGGRPGSRGASIQFLFVDGGMLIRQNGPMKLDDKTMHKLTGLAKKLRDAWLQAFFAEAMLAGRAGWDEPAEEFEETRPDGGESE